MSNRITSSLPPLYQREGDYIPRVAAVHDLCGYGKCSLGVAIPVLSAAGCDVCPVPTGLFSSHTAFPGWYMHDTTAILPDYLEAWKGIGVDIDAVYSGFLGAPEQVDIIKGIYETYPKALRIVDPVMADHGKVYATYTPELCSAMAELAEGADILTPTSPRLPSSSMSRSAMPGRARAFRTAKRGGWWKRSLPRGPRPWYSRACSAAMGSSATSLGRSRARSSR